MEKIIPLKNNKILGIIGAGSWGNTLANLFSPTFNKIIIWDRNPERAKQSQASRKFLRPIEFKMPDNVYVTSNINECFISSYVLNCIPVKAIKNVFDFINTENQKYNFIKKNTTIINCSKGIEISSFLSPVDIIKNILNQPDKLIRTAALAGPNLSIEVLNNKPMIATIAGEDINHANELKDLLTQKNYRLYPSADITGVELCSSLKNIIAIAAGTCDGLELGASSKASLITRALNEMLRVVEANGGDFQTLICAAGIGDLIATSNSQLSRNYRVGFYRAQGDSMQTVYKKLNAVAEGVGTAEAIHKYAIQNQLDLPITSAVYQLVSEKISATEMLEILIQR